MHLNQPHVTRCVSDLDAGTKKREKRRFREISPLFLTLKFFKILQMHFGFVDRFEPAKAFLPEGAYLREMVETFTKLWYNDVRKAVG